MSRPIQIVEVGPRDGLQNEKAVLEPAIRAELARRLEAAGARRIEAVSFVHPKYVPQMAGAEEVMAALPTEPGRSRIGLVLNGRGYDRAITTASGAGSPACSSRPESGEMTIASVRRAHCRTTASHRPRSRREGGVAQRDDVGAVPGVRVQLLTPGPWHTRF